MGNSFGIKSTAHCGSTLSGGAVSDAVMDLIKNRDGLVLGICNGFQALIKLGLLPFGEIRPLEDDTPTLTYNYIDRHISQMVQTRISSTLSPWLAGVNVGDIHTIAVSHGEGRFTASEKWLKTLEEELFDCPYGGGSMYNVYADVTASAGLSTLPDGKGGTERERLAALQKYKTLPLIIRYMEFCDTRNDWIGRKCALDVLKQMVLTPEELDQKHLRVKRGTN